MRKMVCCCQRGFSLVSVIMLVGLLLALSTALAVRVRLDTLAQAGFHTAPKNLAFAEAGTNEATAQFRNIFVGGNIPTGNSSSHTGDYAMQTTSLVGQSINFQLGEPVSNPTNKRLPLGVPFGGLNVSQFNYSVASGTPDLTNPAAQLRSQFQVNNIPTFQFLAFYNGRLDITPAEDMTVHGRIHTNDDLFLNDSGNTLTVDALPPDIPAVEVSAVGSIYHRRGENTTCAGTVRILSNSTGALSNLPCGQASAGTIASYGGTLTANLQNIGLPPGFSTARLAPSGYWAKADLRIVLDLTNKNFIGTRGAATVNLFPIVVQNADGSVNGAKTTALLTFMHASPGSIFYTDVPVTTDNGSTSCTTQSTATTYVSPTYSPPACGASSVATAVRYNPPFQGSNWVYRRVDKNSGANNRSANWMLGTGATNDQLVNNGGSSTTVGDYRRGGFYNNRENKWQYLLNVDLQDLLTWNLNNGGPLFDPNDNSDGGTVMFLSVVGPIASGINNYGVRVLDSPLLPGYPLNVQNPLGITVVSDQQAYVEGNCNVGPYAPTSAGPTGIPWTHPAAAVMGDTMNVLSQNWENPISRNGGLTYANDQKSATDLNVNTHGRVPSLTTIYAAFAAGVDDPATATGNYAGGLHNYPRTHEDWELPSSPNDTLVYRGSFVSLTTPVHANGQWRANGTTYNMYTVPIRNWDFDPQFNDVAMLPPMTPTFISVLQIVIGEDFR
jgi:hypothetical protein